MNCKYKVTIKRIQYNYKVQMSQLQGKYKFNIFCTGYNDSEIRQKIEDMYNAWPKVTGEGEEITLNDTVSATMPLGLKGNTYQEGTPTPDTPQEVHVVSGDNEVIVSNGDNTSTTYPINLPEGMFLGSIGDYKDTFFKAEEGNPIYDSLDSATKQTLDSNEWYLEKKIGKVVLNGSESWSSGNQSTQIVKKRFTTAIENIKQSDNNYYPCFSNHFKWASYKDNNFVYITASNNIVWFGSTILEELDATGFKNWLSTHNTELYYILATPTYTKIEGTLASQLESVYRAKSKEGQTNISQVNNDAPFIITASTLKDLSSLGTSTVSTLNTASVNRLGTQVLNQSIDPVNLELNSEDLELNNEEETIEETPEER